MSAHPDQAAATIAPSNESSAGALLVRPSVEPTDLHRLFDCLRREDCVHSWRNIEAPRRGSLQGLLEWENELRPTELFFFYVEHAGQLRLVAGGAVAARISNEFPHAGFCVLSRCYITPEFRGRGFYRDILRYRLEHCVSRFGSGLSAVHIGTADPRVARVVTRVSRPGWPPFVHLGEEKLHVSAQSRTVDDYIMLAPAYLRRLEAGLGGPAAPACVVELRRAVGMLRGAEPARDVGLRVKRGFAEARAEGWFDAHDPAAFEQLVAFCAAVPLIGFEEIDGDLRRADA
jgi:GNAT superfamily N-acetyltransferase